MDEYLLKWERSTGPFLLLWNLSFHHDFTPSDPSKSSLNTMTFSGEEATLLSELESADSLI